MEESGCVGQIPTDDGPRCSGELRECQLGKAWMRGEWGGKGA
jgi:hypothetical protein